MTHMGPMPDSAGVFSEPQPTDEHCRLCEEPLVTVRIWESHCGGYEDYKYTCGSCRYSWWIEGPDA